MEPWQIDGIDRLERSGYMNVLRNLVRSHTCAFWWFDDSAALGESILHSGTMTFVNTGTDTLGITANHVYESYLKDKADSPSIKCQIGSVTVEPERYVASIDTALDIAAFKLPSVLIAGTRVTVHNAATWPPEKLTESDLVVFGGYPGRRRTERIGVADFDFVSFVSRISQSSDDHISVYLNMPHSYWPQGVSVGDNPELGGVSGGPVFLLRTEPIETIEFASVIYEYSPEFEVVFARHAVQVRTGTHQA